MIDFVSGTLAAKKYALAIVDVQGIGYKLFIPASTYEVLPAVGQHVKLYTYQHVREDALQLYAFTTRAEQTLFEVMIGVSGIGPKLALAALSAMTPIELRRYVLDGDGSQLSMIPGVGRKTAERLIIELRDRVEPIVFGDAEGPTLSHDAQTRADALAALETLGLSRTVAERRIRKVLRANPDIEGSDEIIRMALRE